MKFLQVIQRDSLKENAAVVYGVSPEQVIGVFIQEDVWSVYVFTIVCEDGQHSVLYDELRKHNRDIPLSMKTIQDRMGDISDDTEVDSLRAALKMITDGYPYSLNEAFTNLLEGAPAPFVGPSPTSG